MMAAQEYIYGTTHYANRKTREARHYRDCRSSTKPHVPKRDPTCGGAFRCAKCKKLVGWCKGASDPWPDWCDACVHRATLAKSTSEER